MLTQLTTDYADYYGYLWRLWNDRNLNKWQHTVMSTNSVNEARFSRTNSENDVKTSTWLAYISNAKAGGKPALLTYDAIVSYQTQPASKLLKSRTRHMVCLRHVYRVKK
jgi:hypothetical protein